MRGEGKGSIVEAMGWVKAILRVLIGELRQGAQEGDLSFGNEIRIESWR